MLCPLPVMLPSRDEPANILTMWLATKIYGMCNLGNGCSCISICEYLDTCISGVFEFIPVIDMFAPQIIQVCCSSSIVRSLADAMVTPGILIVTNHPSLVIHPSFLSFKTIVSQHLLSQSINALQLYQSCIIIPPWVASTEFDRLPASVQLLPEKISIFFGEREREEEIVNMKCRSVVFFALSIVC